MSYIKGRGAQFNSSNPFEKRRYDYSGDELEEEYDFNAPTQLIDVSPKSIVNKVDSPDIPFTWSMNPYQGCEHGCVYCYARVTHHYWGYSAGVDFEKKILIKQNAPELLHKKLSSKNWVPSPIMLAGNTDCYQPIEKEKKITRKMLEVLWKFKHPVGLITKNALILRDLDILAEMAKLNLVKVSISITTLDENIRRKLEPRTSTGLRRFQAVRQLSDAGVPVNVMIAPIIPSINNYEIPKLVQLSAENGAVDVNSHMVRLKDEIAILFEDWIRKNLPDRADKVMKQVRNVHGGNTTNSEFGTRMKGQGHIADEIRQFFRVSKQKFFKEVPKMKYNLELYHYSLGTGQTRLF